jgi:ribonuclease HII
VVAAAVILPPGCGLTGIDDSKKLSEASRKVAWETITRTAVAYGIGIVEHDVIDRINILRASLKAMEIAVSNLHKRPDFLLIDGNQGLSILVPQETIVKGDAKCSSIAAASILAKVTRDSIMERYHEAYPQYNFCSHKGYATKEHLDALREHGPCPIHRRTFSGVLTGRPEASSQAEAYSDRAETLSTERPLRIR